MEDTFTKILGLKERVRERDGYRCTECGITDAAYHFLFGRSLDVHRIKPGGVYSMKNCITLCCECHRPKPRSKPGEGDTEMVKISKESRKKLSGLARSRGWPHSRISTFLDDFIAIEYAHARAESRMRWQRTEEAKEMVESRKKKANATREAKKKKNASQAK